MRLGLWSRLLDSFLKPPPGRSTPRKRGRTVRSGRPLFRMAGIETLEPRMDVASFWFDSAASVLHVTFDSSDYYGLGVGLDRYWLYDYSVAVTGGSGYIQSTGVDPGSVQKIEIELGSGYGQAGSSSLNLSLEDTTDPVFSSLREIDLIFDDGCASPALDLSGPLQFGLGFISDNGTTKSLDGGLGTNVLNDDGGTNILNDGGGTNTLNGTTGTNTLNDGGGTNILNGGTGDNTLNATTGTNTLLDGGGTNILNGGSGTDILEGTGGGFNALNGGTGVETLFGGSGTNRFADGGGNEPPRHAQRRNVHDGRWPSRDTPPCCTSRLRRRAVELNNATLNFDVGAGGSDQISDSGAASVSGVNRVEITQLGSTLSAGASYTLISAASGLDGKFVMANGATAATMVVSGHRLALTLQDSGTALEGERVE